jgi:hypothetical protein
MTENADADALGRVLKAVVPPLYFYCGWSPRTQPQTAPWTSPRGVRTWSQGTSGVPYGPDRWILLYLAAKVATYGRRFRGTLREISEMFALP